MILEFRNIEKSFGDKKVLKGINFTAKSGVANGYLGRNGSGKTTSFRVLLDIFKPDKGEILLDGKPLDHSKVKIGYLPEERGMYDGVGLVDQLAYFGMLKGMTKKAARDEAKKWLDFFELEDNKQALKTLSKGNAQKIQIIQSVMNDPDILVFDEPFSGLDPVNPELLKNIIIELVKEGKYVIMSAHQMQTIEEFCENILILNKGKTVLQGNLSEIKEGYPANRLSLNTKQDVTKYIEENNMEIELVANNNYKIKINNEEQAHKLLKNLVDNNIVIDKFEIQKPTLNDIFIEKVGE